jgi:hypothetical protein
MTLQTNGNGANGKLSWWLIGLVSTIILGAAGTTMRSVQNDGERIAVLESQVKDTRDELQRINRKLDQLLEHRNGHSSLVIRGRMTPFRKENQWTPSRS